uniref:Uncharacterized protein n=1 Tax=Arundo donax TaxID=35708 RepID=A0A0A8Z2B8_ARUDO
MWRYHQYFVSSTDKNSRRFCMILFLFLWPQPCMIADDFV